MDSLLSRPVRLHLPDRNGDNEKYFEDNDKIYILDLADDSEFIGRTTTIKEELKFWLKSMIDLYFDLESNTNCGENYECLLIPFDSFSQGYISSLPMYDSDLVILMLKNVYFEIIKHGCEYETPEVCLFQDKLWNDGWADS